MAHIIQLAVGAFMSSQGVNDRTKSWKAHESDQQFAENQSIDIGKSQRLRKEGNPRINKVSAMRPGLAKIIEKVRISTCCESPETHGHIADDACCIDYADTWSSKRVHWLSKSQRPPHSTTNYGCEDTLELNTGVVWAILPITRIHPQVAPKSNIQRLPTTLHVTGWMDHCSVHHGSFDAIPILDPVDVEEAYSHIPSRYRSLQWHVRSYGWRYVSFGEEQDSMGGGHVLLCEVSSTEAVEILCWSDSDDGYACHFCTDPRSYPDVAIGCDLGQGNGL